MTLAALEQSLGPHAPERCLIFVSHEDPDFTSGRLASSLRGTPWEYRVVQGVKGADFQVRFIEEASPHGSHLVVLDDNIERFVVEHQRSSKQGGNRELTSSCEAESELARLVRMAGSEMDDRGANVWTISPTFNHFILFQNGEQIRRNRAKHGPSFPEYTTKLGLVYGACFGFRVLHDASRYTRYGQVKDDVERSLRYWHKDQIMLRFRRYAVVKSHKPGQFSARKGGISAGSSAEKHAAEIDRALRGMLEEFAKPYASLPGEGEKSHCGLIFNTGKGKPAVSKSRSKAERNKGSKRKCKSLKKAPVETSTANDAENTMGSKKTTKKKTEKPKRSASSEERDSKRLKRSPPAVIDVP